MPSTVRSVPGLSAMILFSAFNNLIGGVFVALVDPYGLTFFPVELWGLVMGATSSGFIVGGLLVTRFGLGRAPVRVMLLANLGAHARAWASRCASWDGCSRSACSSTAAWSRIRRRPSRRSSSDSSPTSGRGGCSAWRRASSRRPLR